MNVGNATRLCGSNREWDVPVVANCLSNEFANLLNLMDRVCLHARLSKGSATLYSLVQPP